MSRPSDPESTAYRLDDLAEGIKVVRDALYNRPQGILYRLEVLERGIALLEVKLAISAGMGAVFGGIVGSIITGVVLKLLRP